MTICLDLPMPTSVNQIYRKGKHGLYKSKKYTAWQAAADDMFLEQKQGQEAIKGHFWAGLILNEKKRRGDLDNRAKAVLDALQRWQLIENDSLCDELTISWGRCQHGCRIYAFPAVWSADEESFR